MMVPLEQLQFPVQYLEVFESFLRERGRSTEALAAAVGPAVWEGTKDEGMLDGLQLLAILRAVRAAANPAAPLSAQLLEHFPVTAHGTLGIVILTSPNLEAALEAALRFYPLVMPAYDIQREDLGDQVHLVFRPLCDFGDFTADMDETIVGAFNSIRRYIKPSTQLLELHLKHAARFPLEAYSSFADPQALFFESTCNKVVIPKRYLQHTLTTSNRATMAHFRAELDRQAQALDLRPTFTQRVRGQISQALKNQLSVSREDVAERLNMSPRTLGRRLQEENINFKTLVNATRLDYAEFLLLNSQRSISQVAYAAGFVNESSFSRAFRRRKGCSPSELRLGGGGSTSGV
ncbi:helix-turn-helix domain-containing protein [Marinobacteraceae bacterium S3BR75-40.1]